MGWPARGAHIASKCTGCPSACLAIVAADRRGALWVAVASTGCPPALPGRNVVFSLSGARRSTAGTVAPGTYSTCSGGRWWASFPCGGLSGSGRLCVFQNRLYASRTSPSARWGCPGWVAALRMWFSRSDLLGHSGCCRNGIWCVPTHWRAFIWFGLTRARWRVVPTRSRVVVLPVVPPPTSV